MRVQAQFPGTCEECGGPIRPGELVVRGTWGWIHDECPDAMPEPRAIDVCPHCRLVRPCEHDED
jgi:hypothetical protein